MKTYKSKTKRDYKGEYKYYHSLPEQKLKRAARNHSRRLMIKLGKVRHGSSRDVDHKNHNVFDNHLSNLRVIPRSINRSKK